MSICYKQAYLKTVLKHVLLCAIKLNPICSLLDSACIILIISWLRTALDFTLRFSFIYFRSALLQLLSSALPASTIFGPLPAPLLPLLSLPLWCGGGGHAGDHDSRSDGTRLGAGRFMSWPCSFPDSWSRLDNHLEFSWLSARVTLYSSTVGRSFVVESVLCLLFEVLLLLLLFWVFFFSVQKRASL